MTDRQTTLLKISREIVAHIKHGSTLSTNLLIRKVGEGEVNIGGRRQDSMCEKEGGGGGYWIIDKEPG